MSIAVKKPRFVRIDKQARAGYYIHPETIVVYEYSSEIDLLYMTTVYEGREYYKRVEGAKCPTPREMCMQCRKFLIEIIGEEA